MAEKEPGLDPIQEDARLNSLDERLAKASHAERVRSGAAQYEAGSSSRLGNRVLAELIGGMVGGALIGWVLDRVFGTSPWLLLVLLALGIISAFRNIIRISGQRSK